MPEVAAVAGRDVVLAYNGSIAVAKSDFSVPVGKITAIIGPNASGKSTLLNSITGLANLRSGTIEVLGESVVKARSRVAYVLQATKVNEVMPVTVREVVAMGRYARLGRFRPFRRIDAAAVRESMERLDVADLAQRHLTELSGGQRQRVFVAQGLAQEADVFLLDEPVNGLDIVSRDRIVDVMRAEIEAGRTVVLTTHDLADAGDADHVILMAGRVMAEGTPHEVLDPDLLSRAYRIGIVHLEDGSIVLDDAAHRGKTRHVHFERGSGH